jgi:hypothetical protein
MIAVRLFCVLILTALTRRATNILVATVIVRPVHAGSGEQSWKRIIKRAEAYIVLELPSIRRVNEKEWGRF